MSKKALGYIITFTGQKCVIYKKNCFIIATLAPPTLVTERI